jgi:hypothetical protein
MNTNYSLSLAEKRWVLAEARSLYTKALAYGSQQSSEYCFHGVYVGGCGIDFMCGYCESGELGSSHYDYLSGVYRYKEALMALHSARRQAKALEVGKAIMALLTAENFVEADKVAKEARANGIAYILR